MNNRDPLYKKIYDDLKYKIESHIYADGQYLPAERLLSTEYQVERLTLRKALKLLQEEGYIQTLPGAGSRVIAPSIPDPPDSSYMIAFVISGDMDRQAQLYHIEICNYLEEYCKADGANVLFAKVCANDDIPPYLRHPTLNHYFRHFFGTNDSRYRYCPVKNSIIRYVIPHAKPFIRADMIT